LLLWLQVVAALIGVFMSLDPASWLDGPCGYIQSVGICQCSGDSNDNDCYGNQLIYRAEMSVFVIFIMLLILCLAGAGKQAGRDCPIGKFLVLFLLILVSLFLPNSMFSVFGSFAGVASAIYLMAQTILLMDFGYSWNSAWDANAHTCERELNLAGKKRWRVATLVASGCLFLLSIVELALLMTNFDSGSAQFIVVSAFILAIVLLAVSITEWCEHGALLTSCVVLAYIMWLSYEALSKLPLAKGGIENVLPTWVGLLVCAMSLMAFTICTSSFNVSSSPDQQALAEQGVGISAAPAAADDDSAALDVSDFAVQCAVQACAAIYIASSLAPSREERTFVARTVAVFLSLALYGWTLVAPKVLSNRDF